MPHKHRDARAGIVRSICPVLTLSRSRLVAVSGIHIHRVRHGRLIEHWEELNLLGVLRQLGALS